MKNEDRDRRVDLDGLQVFDAVMREGSVTRAADRLSLTQPAVSHALARLRLIFKDPLFVRAVGGVKPTSRAVDLWSEVQEALLVLKRAVKPGDFDPSTAQFSVVLAVNDAVVQYKLALWCAQLLKIAPKVRLAMVMRVFGDTESRIAQGTLDFGIGLFYSLPPTMRRQELWSDRHVCVFRRGHPLEHKPWTVASFLRMTHVAVSPDGTLFTYADGALRYAGIERTIGLLVSQFTSVPPILQSTDLVAMLPRFYASAVAESFGLQIREPPFSLQPVKYELVWHERIERLRSHTWFRDHLIASLKCQRAT